MGPPTTEQRRTSKMTHISRRRFLGTTSAAAAATVLGSTRLTEMLSAKAAPAVLQDKPKLTYWGGLIFSDDANNLLVDTINQWGEVNNVDTEVVMINQNETNQKVSAAVESGTMPDALDMGLDLQLLLTNTDQLLDVSDLYTKIGDAHGGWFASVDNAAKLAGAMTGIPFGPSGNLLFSRADVLQDAGLEPPPSTWQEVRDWSKQVTKPPLYGMGFALSNVGDGNLQASVLQSYGGRIADDAGTTVTLDSPETREYMDWVTGAFADGLFPPGATTWDGAGDNTAYLAGQAVFIANTGSVHIAAATDDPELDAATNFAALPAGPVMQVSPITPNVRAIPASSKDPDTAKALIEFLANKEFMEQYLNVAIYGPALNGYADFAIFQEPVHAGLLNLVQNGTAPGAPDVYNTAYADFSSNFIVPKMVQRVVIDGLSIDDAIKEAQEQGQLIYDKYK
jgi:multiple sugar transport system substrate-binding protein